MHPRCIDSLSDDGYPQWQALVSSARRAGLWARSFPGKPHPRPHERTCRVDILSGTFASCNIALCNLQCSNSFVTWTHPQSNGHGQFMSSDTYVRSKISKAVGSNLISLGRIWVAGGASNLGLRLIPFIPFCNQRDFYFTKLKAQLGILAACPPAPQGFLQPERFITNSPFASSPSSIDIQLHFLSPFLTKMDYARDLSAPTCGNCWLGLLQWSNKALIYLQTILVQVSEWIEEEQKQVKKST